MGAIAFIRERSAVPVPATAKECGIVKTSLRLALSFIGAVILTSGCVSRPKGAYKPRDTLREPSMGTFVEDAGVELEGGPRSGLPNTPGIIGSENGEALSDAERVLLPLTGRYVMRAEIHSVAEVNQAFARLKVENTATNLSVAEVSLDPDSGKLRMTERLCYQRFQHRCVTGCTNWSTDVDARVTQFFPYVDRILTVAGEKFASATAFGALGYDGSPDDLPATDDDSRVWNVSGDEDVREGVLTRIHAEGTPVGSVDCVIYTVQRFASSFEGSLRRGKLDGASAMLDTQGTDGRRLGAGGRNASTCEGDSGGAGPGSEPNTVSFARIPLKSFSDEAFWACPGYEALAAALDK